MRIALASGWRDTTSTSRRLPAMMPACGPPNSLSPEKNITSTPAAALSWGIGSCARPNGSVSSRQPLPRSCSTGTPRLRPISTSSAMAGEWVKPTTRKLLAWTSSSAPVSSPNSVLEIARVGAVGGANLHQLRAALLQNVGNTEPPANLNRLAARNDNLLSGCDGGEAQQHGRGVVVDDQGRLGTGQLAHVSGDGRLAGASPSGVEVQLQVAIARGGLPHRVCRGFAERCASHVGVQHHPGCVDYAAGRRSEARARESRDVAGHVIDGGRCAALVRDAPPGEREPIAHQVQHRATRVGARQRVHAAVAHHPVDAWQRPELRSHLCPRA